MHAEAYAFIRDQLLAAGPFDNVIEFGSLNINGSARRLLPDASWFGVDLQAGPDVDLVADARNAPLGTGFDLCVCAEVAEHCREPMLLIDAAYRVLKPGGVLLFTAACDPRAPHSGVDGGSVGAMEFYANIDPEELTESLKQFTESYVEHHPDRGDVYAVGVK